MKRNFIQLNVTIFQSFITRVIFTRKDLNPSKGCKTYMQLLSFVYTELVISDVKGIPDFEEFIHVTTGRHVAFLVRCASRVQGNPRTAMPRTDGPGEDDFPNHGPH